ncbi:carbohydrate-binding protein [Rouxiella sp. S1S-2]|uniref:glycosyl hydrolase family 18 protein n=1 Tax=Rouxiella sp. S1S-2 TaxID=2653856 RepID=UPI00186AFBCB|nr:carbohydrate-binding protein [Rouxiella sp. S1S-2]
MLNKLRIALLVGAALLTQPALAADQNRTISYLTSWGLPLNAHTDLENTKVDTFLLSFGEWDAAGNINSSDHIISIPKYNEWSLDRTAYETWTTIKLDHPEKKMMVAFGGETYERMWAYLDSPAARENIAQGLVKLLDTGFPVYKKNLKPEEMQGECSSSDTPCNMTHYQKAGTVYLDGIDFDFEKGARLTPQENNNLLLLAQRIRQLIGANSTKLLSLTTYHVGADPIECLNGSDSGNCSFIGSDHSGEVLPLLTGSKGVFDFYNVMAYDAGRDFKYAVAMNNYANAVGDKSKIVLGTTINDQWAPGNRFVETKENNVARAEWQAKNNYGGFFVWALGSNNQQMNLEHQVEYINDMREAAGDNSTPAPDVDYTAPTAPGNLQASVTGKVITLNWQPSTDNVGVTGYWIYRDSRKTDATPFTTWKDNAAVAGIEHSYHVVAHDAAGNRSQASETVNAKIVQDEEDAVVHPHAPNGLAVHSVTKNSLNLSWKPVNNVTVTKYHVYRNGVKTATTANSELRESGLTAGTTYRYYVIAETAKGVQSAASATFTAKTSDDTVVAPSESDWKTGTAYKAGTVVTYQGKKYRCLQPHSAIESWNPVAAFSLWKAI